MTLLSLSRSALDGDQILADLGWGGSASKLASLTPSAELPLFQEYKISPLESHLSMADHFSHPAHIPPILHTFLHLSWPLSPLFHLSTHDENCEVLWVCSEPATGKEIQGNTGKSGHDS